MRIEPGQHAVDRGFDQLAVVRLLDIVGTHPFEHVSEQAELPIGVGRRRCRSRARTVEYDPRLGCHERQGCACRCSEENEGSFAHHPRTFSLSFAAHHGPGSTGVPSFRNSTYNTGCPEPAMMEAAACAWPPITA